MRENEVILDEVTENEKAEHVRDGLYGSKSDASAVCSTVMEN